jgi:hypothetical protein
MHTTQMRNTRARASSVMALSSAALVAAAALAAGCSSESMDPKVTGEDLLVRAPSLPGPNIGQLRCSMAHPLAGLRKLDECPRMLQGYVLHAPLGTTCPVLRVPDASAYWSPMTSKAQVHDEYESDGATQIMPPSPGEASCIYPFAYLWTGFFSVFSPVRFVGEDALCSALAEHPELHYTDAAYFFPLDPRYPGVAGADIHGTPLPEDPLAHCTVVEPDGTEVACTPGRVGGCGSCVAGYDVCEEPSGP